ncbi:hypothetical protein T492DRAFT_983439 [Pavlovales sp. CCMP2436]|nr:hypothetical protein T492DRAFT_983439 [Pavlovales sp. CCMP2436]
MGRRTMSRGMGIGRGDTFELALSVAKAAIDADMRDVRYALVAARVGAAALRAEIGADSAGAPAAAEPAAAPLKKRGSKASNKGSAIQVDKVAAEVHELPALRQAQRRLDREADDLEREAEQLRRAGVRAEVILGAEKLTYQTEVSRREYAAELAQTLHDLSHAQGQLPPGAGFARRGCSGLAQGARGSLARPSLAASSSAGKLPRLRAKQKRLARSASTSSMARAAGHEYWNSVSVPLFMQRSGLGESFRNSHGVPRWAGAGLGGDVLTQAK